MTQRLAGSMALIAFAICLLVGGYGADNPFGTAVSRALVAMVVTFFVGLVVGRMAEKMIEENVTLRGRREAHPKNFQGNEMKPGSADR